MRAADPTMPRRTARAFSLLVAAVALAACGTGPFPSDGPGAGKPPVALPAGHPARIEVRRLDARPRLTLVSRDGDPTPAVAAVFLTGLGPAPTTALAAVVEARLRSAGFEADVRVDRDAFRVRLLLTDAGRTAPFFAALVAAVSRPLAAGSPEVGLAVQRVASLKRNPLDAAELVARRRVHGHPRRGAGGADPRSGDGSRPARSRSGAPAGPARGPHLRGRRRAVGVHRRGRAGAGAIFGVARRVRGRGRDDARDRHERGCTSRLPSRRVVPGSTSPSTFLIRSWRPPSPSGWGRRTRRWCRGCACCPSRGG